MRRAVHGLLAVAMLAGVSLALAGALAAVALEMSGVSSRAAVCQVWRAELHGTSDSTAYLSVSAANLGSGPWASAFAAFAGDGGAQASLAPPGPVPAGGAWDASGSVPAKVTAGKQYLVRVSASAADGSETVCTRSVRAQ